MTQSRDPSAVPLVEMRGISRAFGGVAALQNVDLSVYRNEVVALLGDNGAGKSTLIKILAGALAADTGEILLDGRKVSIDSPRDAKDLGIETVYQDLALCDNLDVPTNLFLGRELMRPILGPLISIFDRRGELRARWGGGRNPRAPGDFFAPHGIWVDSRGDIYVAEVVLSAGGNRGLVPSDCHKLQKFVRRNRIDPSQ